MKMMIEIWQKYARFMTTRLRFADQEIIIKKGCFSDIEILKMRQKTNNESK